MAGRWVTAGCGGAATAAGAVVSELAGAGFGARGGVESVGWIDVGAWTLMVLGAFAMAKAAFAFAHPARQSRNGR